MICPNCGGYIENENATFCPDWGDPIASSGIAELGYQSASFVRSNDPMASRHESRQAEIDEVNKMINYFSRVNDKYAEYENVCVRLDPKNKQKKVGLLVWGIILSVVGLEMAVAIKALSAVGIMLLLGGIAMIIGFAASSSSRSSNYDEAYAKFSRLSDELYRYYQGYGPCLVSAEYTNPSNLRAIRDTISSGRADSIKEAVNILVEDAHRNNMEAFARQTAISSAAAARGAKASAIFSAANLFIRR